MSQFNFSVSRPKIIKEKPIRAIVPRPNLGKPLNGDIIIRHVKHINGESYVMNDEGLPLKLDEASATIVGKNCYWAFEQTVVRDVPVGYYLRVQYSGTIIKDYPHPYKFKYRKDEEVHGYITINNEFHVTYSPKQKFSNRKSGSRH